jgi:hypothetical protein
MDSIALGRCGASRSGVKIGCFFPPPRRFAERRAPAGEKQRLDVPGGSDSGIGRDFELAHLASGKYL